MAARGPRLGEVVVDQSVAVLAAYDALRADPARGVHEIRVALRRLRSTLTVFDSYLPGDPRGLARRLRAAGAGLSAARDLEVLRERAEALGTSGEELSTRYRQHVDGHAEVSEVLSSVEFLEALEQVRALAQVTVREPSRDGVDLLTSRQLRRVHKRITSALKATEEHRDERLHELRKTIKRARYVLERFGRHAPDAGTLAALVEAQASLGRWQDAVVERRVTGRPPEAHSLSEWIAVVEGLGALRDQVAESLSIRSQS